MNVRFLEVLWNFDGCIRQSKLTTGRAFDYAKKCSAPPLVSKHKYAVTESNSSLLVYANIAVHRLLTEQIVPLPLWSGYLAR
jgi:hypothetical protein